MINKRIEYLKALIINCALAGQDMTSEEDELQWLEQLKEYLENHWNGTRPQEIMIQLNELLGEPKESNNE